MGSEDQTEVVSLGNKCCYPRTVSILEFIWLGHLFNMESFLVGQKDVGRRFARVTVWVKMVHFGFLSEP